MRIITQLGKLFTRKPKIVVVLGATSTGKSDIAVEIAHMFNGEIVSADSRQVYRGMDLGSGKITHDEMMGIPHHLLDVADPRDIFTVQDFQNLGKKAIDDILSHGKLPIICGGTGYYIDNLTEPTTIPEVPPNQKFRESLQHVPIAQLQEMLYSKNDKNIQHIDIHNRVRIIRALEIIDAIGCIPKIKKTKPYQVLYIGLTMPNQLLKERVHARILKRLNMGMLDEVKKLIHSGVSHERLQSLGLEYRYTSKHILGEVGYDEMVHLLYTDTLQFIKRQHTWFKKNNNIHWFNPIDQKQDIFHEISVFLK